MAWIIDLTKYFTAQRIAMRLTKMAPIKSTVMDLLFPKPVRSQYEFPVVPVEEIEQMAQAVPVVRRGAQSVSMVGDSRQTTFIEPEPIRLHTLVRAPELNNLKAMGEGSLEAWAKRRQERMRQATRLVTEILCSQAALDGKIAYPMLQENGQFASYEVTYNNGEDIQSITVGATSKWNVAEASLVKVHKLLRDMAKKLDGAGFGGDKVVLAGSDAMDDLLALMEKTEKPKIKVKQHDDGSVQIGKFRISELSESYRHPKDGSTINKLAPGETRMISKGYTGLIYTALDDLDAKLQPLPMFIKPIKIDDPSGYKLVSESKPLPAVAPKSICKAIVHA